MALSPPILTAVDPSEQGETSIDPFATQAGYERLAERIYPYITVRMARPRFITSIAVGAWVCQPFHDEIAADGVTPPYLVSEWYVAEGFVRRRSEIPEGEWLRFPGSSKVDQTLREGRQTSHTSYLKTPKVFGFTGVHKRLAVGLEIIDDELTLDEGGFELLKIWEEEQGLPGFLYGDKGSGAEFREDLRGAVRRGLEAGSTLDRDSKRLAERITRYLRFDTPGPREARWLFGRLARTDYRTSARDPEGPHMRRELIERLIQFGRVLEPEEEQAFFRSTTRSCSAVLRERLDAVDAYEAICRPMEDTLRLILHLSTARGGAAVDVDSFSGHPLASQLLDNLARAIARAKATTSLVELEQGVQDFVTRYDGVRDTPTLFDAALLHHEEAQREKPPNGRRPWTVRQGRLVAARPQYRFEDPPEGADTYVHTYRTPTVARFLHDLGRILA